MTIKKQGPGSSPIVNEEKAINKKDYILPDMPIGEVVQKYPQVALVFLKYGLHCIGCHGSYWETVEQGAKGHGMDDETFAMLLKEANESAAEAEAQFTSAEDPDNPVYLSSNAITKVKELMEKEGKADNFLRIEVVQGGCAGMSYSFGIDDQQQAEDMLIERDGLKILIDKKTISLIRGSRIDYLETLQGSGFKIDNPNITKSCGCGNSFA
ncbi:iron-sulfur cluster assembly accessory protein [Candidatus Woesearchaeota archaeon]|nr:iron-sulfur cluster assembly accessory protein [Candidatus Woesearchaeota archaeon]